MKLYLEEETGGSIVILKEVASKEEAIQDKTLNPCFFHTCYHDDLIMLPCKREAI